jgi:hypothetical protein
MVETLLSLVLLIAAVNLALRTSLGIHDHTIDGLFLTVTGSMLSLIFLINFIWQLRHQSADELAAFRHAKRMLAHALGILHLKRGTNMRTGPHKISTALALGIVLLLILAFPSRLNASDLSGSQLSPVASYSRHVPRVTTPRRFPSSARKHERESFLRGELLMDADIRLRTAAVLEGNLTLQKAAENARVPLRIIVIAASPLLEV